MPIIVGIMIILLSGCIRMDINPITSKAECEMYLKHETCDKRYP
jgi:hypothetical protein